MGGHYDVRQVCPPRRTSVILCGQWEDVWIVVEPGTWAPQCGRWGIAWVVAETDMESWRATGGAAWVAELGPTRKVDQSYLKRVNIAVDRSLTEYR